MPQKIVLPRECLHLGGFRRLINGQWVNADRLHETLLASSQPARSFSAPAKSIATASLILGGCKASWDDTPGVVSTCIIVAVRVVIRRHN